MSMSFNIKDVKNKGSITISEALNIGETISQYELDEADEQIDSFLAEKIGAFEGILLGEEEKSARGFVLSYNNDDNSYNIKLFSPCSKDDYLSAFSFMKKLCSFLGNDTIITEDEEVYTTENIDSFPYKDHIIAGIQNVCDIAQKEELRVFQLFGIYRPVSLNMEILNEIVSSDDIVEEFSRFITTIQHIDAFSANQRFFSLKDEADSILGAYTITESVRTILPYEPKVEYDNMEQIKSEDVKEWRALLVAINGDADDMSNYEMAGNIPYSQFIERLPKEKYFFIDAEYILVEPLTKDDIKYIINAGE